MFSFISRISVSSCDIILLILLRIKFFPHFSCCRRQQFSLFCVQASQIFHSQPRVSWKSKLCNLRLWTLFDFFPIGTGKTVKFDFFTLFSCSVKHFFQLLSLQCHLNCIATTGVEKIDIFELSFDFFFKKCLWIFHLGQLSGGKWWLL